MSSEYIMPTSFRHSWIVFENKDIRSPVHKKSYTYLSAGSLQRIICYRMKKFKHWGVSRSINKARIFFILHLIGESNWFMEVTLIVKVCIFVTWHQAGAWWFSFLFSEKRGKENIINNKEQSFGNYIESI